MVDAPPAYFSENARINREGYNSIDEVMKRNLNALRVNGFDKLVKEGAWILDTRDPDEFEKAFVKGSLNIGLSGQYAVWVGSLIPFNQQLVLVTKPGNEEESVLRLARVGYENVAGYLEGGVETWRKAGKEMDAIKSINAADISGYVKEGYGILDVRRNSEVEAEHVDGARNISLIDLNDQLPQLKKDDKMLVHCAGGYRSMIAASILKINGIKELLNVKGGFSAIKKEGELNIISGKCATTKFNEKLEQILG
jgi:rhodanese-related sulfurtransferase